MTRLSYGLADRLAQVVRRDGSVFGYDRDICIPFRGRIPALALGRLGWIQQNHVRADTITRSNARLVEAQSRNETARLWGGGVRLKVRPYSSQASS